jgi:hypothetical protein
MNRVRELRGLPVPGISAGRAFDIAEDVEGIVCAQAAMSAAAGNLRKFKSIDALEAPGFRKKIKKPGEKK